MRLTNISAPILLCGVLLTPITLNADTLCTNKKTRAVVARPGACKKGEIQSGALESTATSSSSAAADFIGRQITVTDTGAVSSGSDYTTGVDVSVNRTGASAGTINNAGVNIAVVGDGGGDSTNVGIMVDTSGADTNYSGLFMGGNVGIGVSDPDEILELAGRLHLGQVSAPSSTSDKLYNVGGTLYWNGQEIALGDVGGSDITSIVAGSGLSGGGSSGAVSLSVDTGTTASKIVQLNSSAQLPAVSGINLTNLNATNIASGTISDARLSANVSLLGSSVNLSSEVGGVLPVANGGTGASSLSNLITLGTHTTGSYVTSVATSSGISGGASASESATLNLSLDQTFAASWTATHSFQDKVNIGTTAASVEALHLNGRLHMEPSSAPSSTTNILYNVSGDLFFNGQNLSDSAAGGDITAVVAGTGLTGGGTDGSVTLNVDAGTSANDIVQLNASAQLPAVSGVNLTNLNATALASGTVADARLSSNVSLLGSNISLATEVTGTLPILNGGTGATSLNNLIALGTHTTGDFISAVSAGPGITAGTSGTESLTATIALDQSYAPTWTDTHTFSGVATDIATVSNQDFVIMPNGTGAVGIGVTSPSAKLDAYISSTSSTAGTLKAGEFTIEDTGVVATGSDFTYGLDVNVSRTGASSANIDSIGIDVAVNGDTNGNSTATGLNVLVGGADLNYAAILYGGHVGVGTLIPDARLDVDYSTAATLAATERGSRVTVTDSGVVNTGTDTTYGLEIDLSRSGSTGGTINSTGLDISVTADDSGAGTSSATGLSVSVAGTADTKVAARFVGGSVALGSETTVTHSNIPAGSLVLDSGSLCVDDGGSNCDDATRSSGLIYAEGTSVTGIDLAEEFPVEPGDKLEAGDVVMINTKKVSICVEPNAKYTGTDCLRSELLSVPFVTRSNGDTKLTKRIIGIVSTKPGVTLGGFGQEELQAFTKAPIALAGRVPVKISLENGPIEMGDRLTAASIPGHVRRAELDEHSIGIALEDMGIEQAQDKLLVLVK